MSQNEHRTLAIKKLYDRYGDSYKYEILENIVDRIYIYLIKIESLNKPRDFNILITKLNQLGWPILKQLIDKEIKDKEGIRVKDLDRKSDMDLLPNSFKHEIEEIEMRNLIQIESDPVEHTCIFCKHNKCTIRMQAYSGDESEKIYYTCCNTNCGLTHSPSVKD